MPQLLLFLFSTGMLNTLYSSIAISVIIILVYQLIKTKQVKLAAMRSISFLMLYLFGVFYFLFGVFTIQGVMHYLVSPLLTFIAGWTIVSANKQNQEQTVKSMIYALVLGYGLHALLNYVINVGKPRWLLIDFFSGSIRAATGSGAINTIIFSMLFYVMIIEKRILVKMTGIVILMVSILYAFLLGTRTQFIILLIVFIISIVVHSHEKHGRSALIRSLLIIVFLTSMFIIMYQQDFLSMRNAIEKSNLMLRFQDINLRVSDDTRKNRYLEGIAGLIDHPFGKSDIHTGYYHNFWLDIGRIGGIIPFIIMAGFSYITFTHMLQIFRDKRTDIGLRYMLLGIYIGIQMNFFVEPILEGFFDFFLINCFINGMTESFCIKKFRKGEITARAMFI